jgi:hypothetical protein
MGHGARAQAPTNIILFNLIRKWASNHKEIVQYRIELRIES